MHEFTLATALVDQLLRIAAEHGATGVTRVEVRCGVLQQVEPESLRFAFDALVRETVARGAELRIVPEPVAARCRACGRGFAPRIDDYMCPDCGRADTEVTAGRDVVLQSVELLRADGTAP